MKYASSTFTAKEDITTYGKVSKAGELKQIGIEKKTEINRLSLYQSIALTIHVQMCC